MPVLGICRGMQMLNVSRAARSNQHSRTRCTATRPACSPTTTCELEPGRWPRARWAASRRVKSQHHQGVEELGEGVEVDGRGRRRRRRGDRAARPRFALGVLWHPEEDERSRVVGALVEEARSRRRQ